MDFKLEIAKKISIETQMEAEKVVDLIEIPPQSNMGDYAFPCFQLAKIMRKPPNLISKELAEKFENDLIIDKAESAGGYLNFFINKVEYTKHVINEVLEKGSDYGKQSGNDDKTILVEFSSPNIAKPFHIGHLYTTAIGSAIEKVFRHLGYDTKRLNHIGDYGTQFGKLISAYKRWGNEEVIDKDPINELLKIYVKFHEEAEKDESLEKEGRMYFRQLEENEPGATAIWQKFKDLSLREFKELYNVLNIEFDSYAGESFYSDKMPEIIEMLYEKELLVESEGAKIVDLSQFNLPPCLVIKSDGATIYITRDLAAALYRKRAYDFYKNVYVVGGTQALHFKQVFAIMKLLGYEWADDCVHVGTALVKFADKKLSTRKGDVIFAKNVIEEAASKTMEVIESKNPNLINKEVISKQIGIGAIIYTFLKNSREKDVVFSWEETLSFEGESGPYVQYSYVRGSSILNKAGDFNKDADLSLLDSEDEFNLVKLLGSFSDALKEAAERYEPFVITRYVTELAKAYNKFYNTHHILNAEEKVKDARLTLTKAVCSVIKISLGILGMETPENM